MIAQLGVKKGWATPRLVSFRGFIPNFDEHPRPFHMGFHPRALCKGIQDNLGVWILRQWFWIKGFVFRILCKWNLDSWLLELYSGFQSPGAGSRTPPQAKIFPASGGTRILLHGAINDVSKQVNNCMCCSLCFELPNDKCKIFRFCLTNWYNRF